MRFSLRRNCKPKKNIKCFIYALLDPDSYEYMYIGYTSNLKIRYSLHLSHSAHEKSKKGLWIKYILSTGKKPIIISLKDDIENRTDAKKIESAFIDFFKPKLNYKL